MAKDAIRKVFKIQILQPDAIPMARLAEYMADLATILGEKADVHFVAIADGCTQLIHDIAFTAYPKVQERTAAVRMGNAPADAMSAYRALNKKLAMDNTSAAYTDPDVNSAPDLEFPGKNAAKPLELLPVEQPGSLVGTVQGVGGKTIQENRIQIYIDTREAVYPCEATLAVARELRPFILEPEPRRFNGKATWTRDDHGAWLLKKFAIKTHEALETRGLSEVIEELRSVPSELSELRDPWGELIRSRRDEGGPH